MVRITGQRRPDRGTIPIKLRPRLSDVHIMTKPSSIIRSALGGIIGVVLAGVTAVPGGDSSLCPSGWICPAMPIMSPSIKIGTWYELYWQTPDSTWPGQHWALWTRYIPVGGYYSSGDPSVVEPQFAQIKAAGIDYVLLDDTNGIWNDNGEIEKNAKSIFDTDDQLPTDQRVPLAFVLGTWGYSTAAELQAEADHVWNTYASRPSYLLWKGKPLLVDYGAYDTTFVPDVVRSWTDPHFTLVTRLKLPIAPIRSSSNLYRKVYGAGTYPNLNL
jgi:hypothetical protein